MIRKENFLLEEIIRRTKICKTINQRLAKIGLMRKLLKRKSTKEDNNTTEFNKENGKLTEKMHKTINMYHSGAARDLTFEDSYTMTDENGRIAADVPVIISIHSRKPITEKDLDTYFLSYLIRRAKYNRTSHIQVGQTKKAFTKLGERLCPEGLNQLSTSQVQPPSEQPKEMIFVKQQRFSNAMSDTSLEIDEDYKPIKHKHKSMQKQANTPPIEELKQERKKCDPFIYFRNEKGKYIKRTHGNINTNQQP